MQIWRYKAEGTRGGGRGGGGVRGACTCILISLRDLFCKIILNFKNIVFGDQKHSFV